jgi:methylated-DNA-[protein]-cysteine S-methyltransferase
MNDSASSGFRIRYTYVDSPIGELLLASDGDALTALHLPEHRGKPAPVPDAEWRRDDATARDARDQLRAYFAGELRAFDLTLRPKGTTFQHIVWAELVKIPFGATVSYAELARRIGHPGAARAVGAANGRNPIAIIVPCHRVIAADGTLGGYGGGLDRKEWLLQHEATVGARIGRPRREAQLSVFQPVSS